MANPTPTTTTYPTAWDNGGVIESALTVILARLTSILVRRANADKRKTQLPIVPFSLPMTDDRHLTEKLRNHAALLGYLDLHRRLNADYHHHALRQQIARTGRR
jgi:hypothetical protein